MNQNYRINDFSYKKNEEEKINFFNQNDAYGSIGYGFLLGANTKTRVMIEPFYGFQLYSSLSPGDFTLMGGVDPEDDFFVYNEQLSNKRNTYKGLVVRIIFNGRTNYSKNSASIPIGINFGVTKYDSSPIVMNSKYGDNLILDNGTIFEYPDNQLYYNVGISLNF